MFIIIIIISGRILTRDKLKDSSGDREKGDGIKPGLSEVCQGRLLQGFYF